jgi:hypothetical protein
MISILNSVFTIVFNMMRWTKQDLTCIIFARIFKSTWFAIYLWYILNYVFTVVFYVMRWIKEDPTCIYFKEFLNQLNLIYIYICLYLQQIKSYEHVS